MSSDLSEQQLGQMMVDELSHQDMLPYAARQRALVLLDVHADEKEWIRKLDLLMLCLGAAMFLIGVVYFFAYNWSSMSHFAKFGVIELGIVLGIAISWRKGLEQLSGKVALFVSAALVGPLLAVIGQVYQTGADPYELFVSWAGLIFVWVLLARLPALWVFWLVLLNVAIPLFLTQALGIRGHVLYSLCSVAGLNFIALLFWESLSPKISWMKTNSRWLPRLMLFSVLVMLTISMFILLVFAKSSFLFSRSDYPNWFNILLVSFYIGTLGFCYVFYRLRDLDFVMLSAGCLSLIVVVNTAIGKAIGSDSFTFFFLGFLFLVMAAGAVHWLRGLDDGDGSSLKQREGESQ